MNYVPVTAGTNTNESACRQEDSNARTFSEIDGTSKECIVMPIWKDTSYFESPTKQMGNDVPKSISNDENNDKEKPKDDSNTKQDNTIDQSANTASPTLNTGGNKLNTVGSSVSIATPKDMVRPSYSFEATHFESFNDEDEPDVDLGNILNSYAVPTTPHTRIHKDHPIENVIDLLKAHRAIGSKWVFRNKEDERGIVIRNKARLVAQGHTQEEGIDYDEVFAPVARIKAIRLFLAYASFMGFMVYQMDVKSAFLYGQIEEEVEKALYGLHQAPRAWYETLANYLLSKGFNRGKIDQTLFIKKQKGDILLVQIYVDDKEGTMKYNYTDVKSAYTPVDLEKPLVQDGDATDVDEHLYRSMIGSLMYLRASRLDIMFAVCACARFQVTPKTSYLLAVKRIFRYLKGKPTLGLWYSRDSLFELVAYNNSDYAGATQDRKSTSGDLLTKGFDVGRFQYLVSSIGMVSNEAVHKELGDIMERAATTASSLEAEQDSVKTAWHKLNIRHIKYALTKSPTIYVSYIKQFWKIAIANTKDNREVKLTATIDGHVKTIIEASLRRHLKLKDHGGVTSLPKSEIFEQLALIGYATDLDKLTFQKEEHVPTPHKSPLHSVHSYGSDEGRLQQTDLMNLVTKLFNRIEVLERDLQQTKKTYTTAFTKLKDSSEQGRKISDINDDLNVSLVQDEDDQRSGEKVEREVSTAGAEHSTGKDGVNTASESISTIAVNTVSEIDIAAAEKEKEKGKGIMTEPEPPKKLKKRVQVQIDVDAEVARKLFEEEQARFNAEQEVRAKEEEEHDFCSKKSGGKRRKSLARKRAKETQSEETSKKQKLDEEESDDYEKEKEELRMWLIVVPDEEAIVDPEILHTKYPINDWESQSLGSDLHIYKIIRADGNTSYNKNFKSMLKGFDRKDILDLHRLVMKRFEDITPEGYNLML
ncbi:putative ribonuclease H-like domain-containing protein [Tanacetum coccineum]